MTPPSTFRISRIFNAPRELVFKVNTEPAHLAKWFSPVGMTVIKADMDFRPGSSYHYGLKTPDGHEMWGIQFFREIVVPEKVVFVQSFSDRERNLTRHPASATWPLEMIATVLYEAEGTKTKMTINWTPINASETEIATFNAAQDSMNGGFKGTFDQLDAYLASLT